MASAIESGEVRIVIEDPFGNQKVQHKFQTNGAIAAGGSPDGVLANLTADKQVKVGIGRDVAVGGDRIRLMMKMDAADGLDASDAVVQIAVTSADGVERQLSSNDIGYTTDFPAATPASQLIELGTGYLIPDGERLKVGSASLSTPTVISIQDDA